MDQMRYIAFEFNSLFSDIFADLLRRSVTFSGDVYQKRLSALTREFTQRIDYAEQEAQKQSLEVERVTAELCKYKEEIEGLNVKYKAALAEFDIPPIDASADFNSMRQSFTRRIDEKQREADELRAALNAQEQAFKEFRHYTKQKILDLEHLLKNSEIQQRAAPQPAGDQLSPAAQYIIADLEGQIIDLKRKCTDQEILVNELRYRLSGME